MHRGSIAESTAERKSSSGASKKTERPGGLFGGKKDDAEDC